jgi:hypothetical protein
VLACFELLWVQVRMMLLNWHHPRHSAGIIRYNFVEGPNFAITLVKRARLESEQSDHLGCSNIATTLHLFTHSADWTKQNTNFLGEEPLFTTTLNHENASEQVKAGCVSCWKALEQATLSMLSTVKTKVDDALALHQPHQ